MFASPNIDTLVPPKFKQPTSIARTEQYFQSRNEYNRKNPKSTLVSESHRSMPKRASAQTDKAFETIGATAATAGAAAGIFPALAPVAAGLGVGYGVYKLGKSFDLW